MEPPPLPSPPPLQIERSVDPIAFPDPALEQVLQDHFMPKESKTCARQGGMRYIYNRMDLDGDRTPETLVALLGPPICGPGGCPLVLLREFGNQLTPLQTIQGFHAALMVSNASNQGWKDLIFFKPGGGEEPTAKLSFNGLRYSPQDPGAKALDQPTRGQLALRVHDRPSLVQGLPLPCPLSGEPRRKAPSPLPPL